MDDWNGFQARAMRLDDIDLAKKGALIAEDEDEIDLFLSSPHPAPTVPDLRRDSRTGIRK